MKLEFQPPSIQVSQSLADARRVLAPQTDSPRLEAEVLLAHVLGLDRAALLARPESALTPEARARFEALVARRAHGEPVAYLTGTREFWSMKFEVSRDVLIPRPETERLVEAALERIPMRASARVADLGTGCGAIALAVARERPQASIVATDLSREALKVAQKNLRLSGIGNVRLLACDWFDAIDAAAFDLILSNPPYVADADPHLRQGDLPREPQLALAGGPDGLDAIRVIVAGARRRLAENGALMLEHGFDQGAAVRRLLENAGLRRIFTLKDYAGHDRVSGGLS